MDSIIKTQKKYLLAQVIFWGGYCLLNLILMSLGNLLSAVALITFIALSVLLGLSSHGLRWLYKYAGQRWSLLLVALQLLWLLPFIALTIQLLLYGGIYLLITNAPALAEGVQPMTAAAFFLYTANTAIILLLWSILYLLRAEFFKRRNTEIEHWRLQAEIKERELDFLRSQINSHFLFNAINNLRAMVREDAERARSGLADLSVLLRGILQSDKQQLVTLSAELEWVRGYLSLEALQLEDRLQCEWHIDPALLSAKLPPLALQTLVENAIKHGIAARRDGGTLCVRAQQLNSSVWMLEVTNPLPDTQAEHQGNKIGLHNLRERLKIAYGDASALDLTITDQAKALITIPLMDTAP